MPLDLFLPCRIDLQVIETMAQRLGRLVGENGGFFEQLGGAHQLRVGIPRAAQRTLRLGQQVVGAVGVCLVDRVQRGLRGGLKTAASRDALLFDKDFLDRRDGADLGLQLPQLIAQQIEARFAVCGGRFLCVVVAAAGARRRA